jgi:hypothetical protein
MLRIIFAFIFTLFASPVWARQLSVVNAPDSVSPTVTITPPATTLLSGAITLTATYFRRSCFDNLHFGGVCGR